MELWIIYAILSAIAAGLYNFTYKVITQRNYDTHVVNIYTYAFSTIVFWLYCIYTWAFNTWFDVFLYIAIFSLINTFFFYLSIVSRVESMRNIDTVVFFPLYKTFGPIIVTCIGYFFFQESLSPRELLWIIIGIMIPLLLITKSENIIQKNLYFGVFLVIVTAVLTSISAASAKMVSVESLSLELFMFIGVFIWTIISLMSYYLHSKRSHKVYNFTGIHKFSLISGIFHTLSFFFFVHAVTWNFAVAFTINSFSILIPIILSIIFYWEHFNLKKWMVIVLSIVSILLFI